ncbi:MAG: hypothetical protein AUJ82_04760 [Verrucomicrobia bacterium CG1_02_43_26]|nr:MAG: hypothetical protein AUJ82_04760 [Verrucomicrobia bacterium CG1_02_43_26]
MNAKPIRQQFADTMLEVGKEDEGLVVMVGDISHFALQPFAKACPGRYYNIGICEPSMMSMAAGVSKSGLVPVVHTIAPFLLERSYEQIKLDFCYHKLPGNIVTVGSAFDYANLGCTHHCYGDFAMLKTLQNQEICYPSTAQEFDLLFRQVYRSPKVTIYRIPSKSHSITWDPNKLDFGCGINVVAGKDLTIIATGPQLENAMRARDILQSQGWSPEVIYIHTIWPLDNELIYDSVSRTKNCIVIEEHMQSGGLGSEVLQVIHPIDGMRFHSLSIPNEFIHSYGGYEEQCKRLDLTAEGIVKRVNREFRNASAAV